MGKSVRKKIMVFGTFDGLHQGHINFLKQARNLSPNSFLIVSLARDRNVLRLKGSLPEKKEKERLALIKRSGLADKVVLGGTKSHLPHILKENPHVIALGYDQKAYVKNLMRDLKTQKNNLNLIKITRLKPYKKKIYKNNLLRAKDV